MSYFIQKLIKVMLLNYTIIRILLYVLLIILIINYINCSFYYSDLIKINELMNDILYFLKNIFSFIL